MATQYDNIGKKYASFKQLPLIPIETASIRARLGDVTGLDCLDLACGLGDWTRRLAHLGAKTVTAVDISKSMIDGAIEALKQSDTPNLPITYLRGDAMDPSSLNLPTQYDLIMGNWLLNYAPTYDHLTSMFLTIHSNLLSGGNFLGVTPNTFCPFFEPVDDGYGIHVEAIAEIDGTGNGENWAKGWRCKLTADMGEEGIEFEMFHFMHGFYERAAQEAGLREVRWWPMVAPEGEDEEGRFERFWLRPHGCVLTARRPG